jgi:hypothetical protein
LGKIKIDGMLIFFWTDAPTGAIITPRSLPPRSVLLVATAASAGRPGADGNISLPARRSIRPLRGFAGGARSLRPDVTQTVLLNLVRAMQAFHFG